MAGTVLKAAPNRVGVHEARFGGAWRLLVLSLVFHSVYLSSIFDIYFKSPVTKGVSHRFGVTRDGAVGVDKVGHGLAKRVVLIVGKSTFQLIFLIDQHSLLLAQAELRAGTYARGRDSPS